MSFITNVFSKPKNLVDSCVDNIKTFYTNNKQTVDVALKISKFTIPLLFLLNAPVASVAGCAIGFSIKKIPSDTKELYLNKIKKNWEKLNKDLQHNLAITCAGIAYFTNIVSVVSVILFAYLGSEYADQISKSFPTS